MSLFPQRFKEFLESWVHFPLKSSVVNFWRLSLKWVFPWRWYDCPASHLGTFLALDSFILLLFLTKVWWHQVPNQYKAHPMADVFLLFPTLAPIWRLQDASASEVRMFCLLNKQSGGQHLVICMSWWITMVWVICEEQKFGAGEIAHWRALVALAEDLGWIPSTYVG